MYNLYRIVTEIWYPDGGALQLVRGAFSPMAAFIYINLYRIWEGRSGPYGGALQQARGAFSPWAA